MKNPVSVLLSYFGGLLAFSFLFSVVGVINFSVSLLDGKVLVTPMLLVTIIGGLLCLYLTVPRKTFKIFALIYSALWLFRILLIFVGNKIGQIQTDSKVINVDSVIANYYKYISRIDSPIPFVLFWLVNYLFFTLYPSDNDKLKNSVEKVQETNTSTEQNI